MFWIAVAAQFSLPLPDIRSVFSFTDMPDYVMTAGRNRLVPTRTTIRPDGSAQDCTHEGLGSGDAKLDLHTCLIILKRTKLRPAKWLDGSPAYAVLRLPISYSIDGPPSDREIESAYPDDMDIAVNMLPDARRQARVPLMIAVDEKGQVLGCNGAPALVEADHITVLRKLVPIACQQMETQFRAIPAKDASGKPVRSVQTAFVVFTANPQK